MKTCQYSSSLVLGVGLFVAAGLSWAEEPCRVFTDVKGRSVEGRLLEFNAKQQTVTIQREDNQTFEASLAVFSDADQQYVRKQWFQDAIKVSAELKDFGRAKTFNDLLYKPENITRSGYVILLENGSDVGLVDIGIEYCIYYRQYSGSPGHWMVTEGIQCGRLNAPFVPAGAHHDLMTVPVMLYMDPSGGNGEIQGIWGRAAATLPSGEQIKREFRNPAHIGKGKGWPKTTVLAGLNAELVKQREALLPPHKRTRRPVVYKWGSKSASR
ncbi:hypothetical protein [Pontiella sulfatireligans]|uniref:SLA1 homology domain-containing protein n=1 Tax=Pontiella sulfatireligans TaxID=2750658 RepID=A0A6C2UHV0_9BACT|nr:hypothetical protein [Pontiella sulfatireligans]VGO19770.1 hypothetical protein SCARR_01829 [Pontiella sulfatireligans]